MSGKQISSVTCPAGKCGPINSHVSFDRFRWVKLKCRLPKEEAEILIFVKPQFYITCKYTLVMIVLLNWSPGGLLPSTRMGVCRWVPGNLTLFQTKETQFCYPVPDKMVKIDTLFQSGNCNNVHLHHGSKIVTPTVFQSRNGKKYTLFQKETLICRPCSRLREAKPYPFEWHISV